MNGDPSASNAASYSVDMAEEIDAPIDNVRQLLSDAIREGDFRLAISRVEFEREAIRKCADAVSDAIALGSDIRSAHEIIARIYDVVSRAKDPLLLLACFPVVFSLPCGGGMTETAIAKARGVTRATVSAICIDMKKTFGVMPGRGMRSEKSVIVYRDRQTGKRAKPLPQKWQHKGIFSSLVTEK